MPSGAYRGMMRAVAKYVRGMDVDGCVGPLSVARYLELVLLELERNGELGPVNLDDDDSSASKDDAGAESDDEVDSSDEDADPLDSEALWRAEALVASLQERVASAADDDDGEEDGDEGDDDDSDSDDDDGGGADRSDGRKRRRH